MPRRSGATAMLWTLAPELMRFFLAAVRHRLHPFLDLATPVAIAHRGGAEEAPENTMEAFGAASRSGLPAGGAHVTRDAVVLAFHDPRLPWAAVPVVPGAGPGLSSCRRRPPSSKSGSLDLCSSWSSKASATAAQHARSLSRECRRRVTGARRRRRVADRVCDGDSGRDLSGRRSRWFGYGAEHVPRTGRDEQSWTRSDAASQRDACPGMGILGRSAVAAETAV